uniref:hypothetical protein n=1 Tax=Cupriavidus taiwanensis TaxID=164546 RepID=UPI0011C02B3A|nr:hypothetical protein [Cupriavidus taiwanensis]
MVLLLVRRRWAIRPWIWRLQADIGCFLRELELPQRPPAAQAAILMMEIAVGTRRKVDPRRGIFRPSRRRAERAPHRTHGFRQAEAFFLET